MSAAAQRVAPTTMGQALADTVRHLVGRAQAQDRLKRVTVVTPSFYSSFYLRRKLAPFGLFNVEFIRVDEVAERLAAGRLRQRSSRPLGRLQASALVRASAMQVLDDTTALGRIRAHEATQRALHQVFAELGAVSEEALSRMPQDGHFADLLAVYRRFRELSGSFHDRRTVAELAVEALNGDEWWEPGAATVAVAVEAPPPQYLPLWSALVRKPEVLVAVGLVGEPAADALVTGWAGGSAESALRKGTVPRLISTATRADEVRQVVREVVAAARGGKRLDELAVLHADPSYGTRLRDALRLAGIDACGPDPSIMAHTPEGRFLAGILAIGDSGFARDVVMGWMTSSPVRDPQSKSEAPSARWDSISRSAGITTGLESWRRRLEAYASASERAFGPVVDDESSTAEMTARSARASSARQLAEFVHQLAVDLEPRFANWEEVAKWLGDLAKKYLFEAPDDAGSLRRRWIGALVERIGGLADLVEVEAPTLQRVRSIVEEELARPLRTAAGLGRGVFVGSLSDAVGCVFDTVHVVGMREGLFPPPDRSDPLLPDDVRQIIDPAGRDLPGKAARQAAQRHRFLAAIGAAPKVVLYWPRSESGAVRESAPSAWFVEQARMHAGCEALQAGDLLHGEGGCVTRIEHAFGDAGLLSFAGDPSEYDVASAVLWRRSGMPADQAPLPAADAAIVGDAVALLSARRGSTWTKFDGNLSGAAGGFAAPGGPVSPTRFEKYAACPFRYFLGELAGVAPTEKPEAQLELTALARGTLVHRILEAFVANRIDANGMPPDEQQTLLLDAAELEFRRFERESATGHPAMWQLERQSILRNLRWWLDSEANHLRSGDWTRHHVEWQFGTGNDSALGPVRVNLADGRIIDFRGIMDRVDISADESQAIVFDYKTGSAASYAGLDNDPVLRGTKLQLAVYSSAVRGAFPRASRVGAAYWFVFEDPGRQMLPKDGTIDAATASERLRDVVDVVASGIADGAFPARPGGNRFSPTGATFKNCTYCEYDRICPSQRQRSWSRKRGAASLGRYVAMTGDLEEVE